MGRDQFSRRRLLQVTGTATAMALVAGCADDGGGGGGDDGEDGGNGEDGGGGEVIEGGEEIELGAEVQAWMGQAPDQIADQENPTLVLQEGESYEITWENLDGQEHNIEIVDENDEVVDDYSTETMGEEGETQTLSVDEVTSEMAEYVCRPHESSMRATIEVESNGGGGAEEEDGMEEEDGETEDGETEDGETEDGETEDGETEDSETDEEEESS